MKKILLFGIFLINLLFAIDVSQAAQMVKQNPELLNTPQAQEILKEKGLTKQEVLNKLKNTNSNQNLNSNIKITNEVSEKQTQNTEKQTNNIKKEITTTKNEANILPLKYLPAKQLIKMVQSIQQKPIYISLKRYGERFFYNKNSLNKEILAVPDYYQINKGDIIDIQIFGGNDKTIETKVDNYGNITLPIVGPIYVAGLSVAEVRKLIIKKLKPTYPNSIIVVNVKVNSFIQVTLTGFVKAPGVYNLSSLSTVKDLLIAANGFGELGSMREVYLKRGGKVLKIIDFYKLIKDGDIVDTTLLRNGDIIYVPKAKKLISLSGAVNIPAIYELKPNEKLKDLITYAGGLKPNASSKYIKITHFLKNSYAKVVFRDISSNEELLNGDKVYVYKISELNKNYVYVYGNIEKPGSFEIPKDKKLSTLLKKLTFLKDTYYYYALLERFNGKIISFSIKNPGNIKLKSKDKIYIFNQYQILPEPFIVMKGKVLKNPGKFRYHQGLTLKDAINNSGFKEPFYRSKIQILRYGLDMKPRLIFVNYDKNPLFKIKPFDEITLFSYYDFNPLKPVSISGEVHKPGTYIYTKNMTLKDLLLRAGWITDKADKNYIEYIHYEIKNGKRIRIVKKLNFSDLNIHLYPYDEINVKTIPNWYNKMTITIKGAVKYPGVYVIKRGEKLASVIKRAGGFEKDAYLYGAVFTRESVKKMQEKELKDMIYRLKKKIAVIAASAKGAGEQSLNAQDLISAIDNLASQAEKLKPIGRVAIKLDRNLTKFENSPYNITLENNDSLYVPIKPNTVIVLGEVLTPSAFVYTTDSALKYIKKAGGRTSLADNIFFVVHANGFSEKGKFGSWFDKDVKVKEGDAITVPIQIKTATWYGITKDLADIVYKLAITAASLKTVGAF